jgi:hypothetical protein
MDGTAGRFTRYAERARHATGIDHPPPDSLETPATEPAA